MPHRIGVMFRPEWPPEELPAFARRVEEDGYNDLWLVEDCFLAGGLTMAAAALAVTERIGVGIGLLPVALRNPALAAMEISGLARLHPGRFVAALGHGVDPWMRQIDARPPDRLAALEETVTAVRALLAGETVNVDGSHVHLHGVTLGHPPPKPPPILVGTTGPRALAAAGRSADGILLAEGAVPAAVRWARGQAGDRTTVVYSWLSLDDDRSAAAAALRPALEAWLGMGLYPALREHAGLGDATAADLEDDRVRSLAVAGDARDCARAIAELWAAGADTIVLVPRHEDRAEQIARFTAEVRPLL
ncbi:MAG TPA: LLM class flavin-dependent oxidoreductase [Solirubrobacteraceae bacterium]|nr:LLM class flavin-dependent oxidoreductase [Solirubrobacteraceae bacterium]